MFQPGIRLHQVASIALATAALCLAPSAFALPHSDDLAAYLEQHGLKQLLAVHLESQLEAAPADQRGEIVLRLASIYAELLERAIDPAERAHLEQRARAILAQAPAKSADELRLALIRAQYRAAEKIAENHRMRLTTDDEVRAARRTFDELVPQLQELRTRIVESIELIERRLSRSSGAESIALSDTSDNARNLQSQATFLTAWALYYQAWLSGVSEHARTAEPLFALLLGAESSAPRPDEISVDLRANEAIARSILGMALCKSMTSSSATSIAWLELLDHPNTFQALRDQNAAWKIAVHLEFGEYQQVQDIVDAQREQQPELPLAWLRLIAVHALEEDPRPQRADELVKFCVTELASRGELQQVLDLATRYGADALGGSGFAMLYVRGVTEYQAAREAHGSEEPTVDPPVLDLYRAARATLTQALAEDDAAKLPAAAAACQRLIGWCLYFSSNFLEARKAFEQAAAASTGPDAEQALWMAIVSLDRLSGNRMSAEFDALLGDLIDRFLRDFPESTHAAELLLRRSIRASEPSPELIDELLAIPRTSDVYELAQRRVADMRYALFRAAGENERQAAANAFLGSAVPLIGPAARQRDLADAVETQRLIVRCRQVLEVALAEGVERLNAAQAAFEALDDIAEHGKLDREELRDELAARRAQERLYAGDIASASSLANELWSRDSDSIWSRLATRALFRGGFDLSKRDDASPQQRREAIELIVRYGGRVLHEFKDDSRPLERPGAVGYHAAVADASMALWEQTGDEARGRAALFLFERLLAHQPSSARFQRATALLKEQLVNPAAAVDHWRRLVAGLPDASHSWYEAKFHLIRAIAADDPQRARNIMAQHRLLHPEYGLEPWGARLKGLDETLANDHDAGATDPGAATRDEERGDAR